MRQDIAFQSGQAVSQRILGRWLAGLLDRVKQTRDQVHEVVAEIDKQRDELGRQLVMFERKKRVSAAYAGNRLPVMAVI